MVIWLELTDWNRPGSWASWTCLGKRASVIKCEWSFDLVREKNRRPSFGIFVVCSTLILSGVWWHRVWSFFLILFEGKRRRGEFKIGLMVLDKSKPREAFIMQLSCLLCLPSRWVGPCVPSVIEGSKDAALVWIKGEPRKISYWAVSHLESCQASTMELLRKNSQRPQQVDIFPKKGQSQMFGWIPNAPPIVGVVNVRWRWIGSAWNLQPQFGVLGRSCEAPSDYKKSYFWWCRNIACGDSTGSN